jgi:hypothetical protein
MTWIEGLRKYPALWTPADKAKLLEIAEPAVEYVRIRAACERTDAVLPWEELDATYKRLRAATEETR